MTVSLSYDNFPNIWDAILAGTSWDAKIVLRVVCKSLRDVVDRLLVQHLVLEKGKNSSPDAVDVFSPQHRIPRCRALCPMSWASKPRRQRLLSDLMTGVKVIDLRGYIMPRADMARLAPLFPNLEVLRITTGIEHHNSHTAFIPFKAEKLVLFMNNLGSRPDKNGVMHPIVDFNKENARNMDPADNKPPHLPETYRKVVLNMSGITTPVEKMYPYFNDLLSHAEELVIVVPQFKRVTDEGWITDRLWIEFPMHAHLHITFVGLERVEDGEVDAYRQGIYEITVKALYLDVDYTIDDQITLLMPPLVRKFFIEESERRRHESDSSDSQSPPLKSLKEKVDGILARYEFLTMPQYIERVGLETAALEVEEYGREEDHGKLLLNRRGISTAMLRDPKTRLKLLADAFAERERLIADWHSKYGDAELPGENFDFLSGLSMS